LLRSWSSKCGASVAPSAPFKLRTRAIMTRDDELHKTTTLFAVINISMARCSGAACSAIAIRSSSALSRPSSRSPGRQGDHVTFDDYAVHKHAKVRAWLARHPRWTFHFKPASASWLNAVENIFSVLTRRWLKPEVFRSLNNLQGAIKRYIADHDKSRSPLSGLSPLRP